MKRIGFALAAGFGAVLFAVTPVTADTPTTAAPTPTPTIVTGTTTSGEVITTSSTRRGILARLRDRRGGTTTVMPATSGTIITTPAPTTAPATVPAPLPSTKPSAIVTPAGGMIAEGTVVTASYVEPVQTRRGVLSRFRERRSGTTMSTVPMTVTAPALMPMPMSSVTPASGTTTPMATVATTEVMMSNASTVSARRMGLIARLRARY